MSGETGVPVTPQCFIFRRRLDPRRLAAASRFAHLCHPLNLLRRRARALALRPGEGALLRVLVVAPRALHRSVHRRRVDAALHMDTDRPEVREERHRDLLRVRRRAER